MYSWRAPQYRLMQLTKSGRAWLRARGAVPYLLKLARLARIHGRQWIDLDCEPAVEVKYLRQQVVILPTARRRDDS